MKPDYIKIKGLWEEVVDDCRSTVSKPPLSKDPSGDFKRRILLAEHSPIRDIVVRWKWSGIPSWVATHWTRHKWECYVSTQRSDRTSVPRDKLPQDAPVDFVGEANAQHLIDTWRKRLCRQAAPETRQLAEDFKAALHDIEPELSDVLVPACIYRGGCPEMHGCGFYTHFLAAGCGGSNIEQRYSDYNRIFYSERKPKKEG